ncbi:uracil-DNA glycosylase family protein [Fictibacillus sp. NRS-1165]|uniref:uracil-DNA glycosylase family protein n=1 Tax=Fictibacillus sp. NRS-1165 TaxID=3144463 RepID=UPI003D218E98
MDLLTIQHAFQQAKEQFSVADLISPDVKILFILESPHREEIKHHTPLAGSSGRSVSKVLFDGQQNTPLGLLLKENRDEESYCRLGILNVCSFPLQAAAIPDRKWREDHAEFVQAAEKVRVGNDKDVYRNETWNAFQETMLQDFKQRLKVLLNQPLVIVPCGRFAQKQFRLADVHSSKWRVVNDVPHPSYNSWAKERYRGQITEVVEAVAEV